ncbi:DUF2799 domain-containing protein, partial [Aeromonas veronii]|uniref:DUF2799 domain-containing protein n=1 Tax=Aeromonas veronii TaxID=654 RepID=UPI001F3FC6E6
MIPRHADCSNRGVRGGPINNAPDGKLGFTTERIEFHQGQCGKKVDAELWKQGHQKGLAWYCRPEHLYLAG